MRFFHISDLHIGKQLHERSLLEDQRYILSRVVDRVNEYKPDAVIIAGDVYDKSTPSAEAVTVFDDFITALKAAGVTVMLISGNHDSAERLSFGSRIFEKNSVYFAGMPPRTPDDHIKKVTLNDEWGEIDFWLLPFVKPGYVRGVFADTEYENAVDSYDSAVKALIMRENIDYSRRNVLVSHQLYTNGGAQPYRCDSETINIGGIDNIDIQCVENFDYIALGHIHRPQCVKNENARYCGTLLQYSVSEENDRKVLTMVGLGAKGTAPKIQEINLTPLRNVRQIKGKFADIIEQYEKTSDKDTLNDYVSVVLTDESEIFNAGRKLADIFPNILTVSVQNSRTGNAAEELAEECRVLTPIEEFKEFFRKMQGRDLTQKEEQAVEEIINEVNGG